MDFKGFLRHQMAIHVTKTVYYSYSGTSTCGRNNILGNDFYDKWLEMAFLTQLFQSCFQFKLNLISQAAVGFQYFVKSFTHLCNL